MNIAVIPSWTKTKKFPFAGIYMYDQALDLSGNHLVEFLVFERSVLQKIKLSTINNFTLVKKHAWFFPKINEFWIKKWSISFVSYFSKRHQLSNFNVIHAHDHLAAYVAYEIWKSFDIPYIITVHNTAFINNGIEDWRSTYIKTSFCHAKKVISVGKSLSAHLQNKYGLQNLVTIPNYYDKNKVLLKNPVGDGIIRVISVGSLHLNKGYDLLLKAVNKIMKENEIKLHLTIIGDGNMHDELTNYINSNQLNSIVTLAGWKPNSDVYRALAISDIYVCSSRVETFGISVLEALGTGIPALVTACGGPEHFVNDDCGIIIDAGDENTIYYGLLKIISIYKDLNSEKIKNYALSNFEKDIILPMIEYELNQAQLTIS